MAACEGGRVDVVRSLMEKATSLGKLEEMCNQKDAAGKTPFDMAAAGQHKVSVSEDTHQRADGEGIPFDAGQRASRGENGLTLM